MDRPEQYVSAIERSVIVMSRSPHTLSGILAKAYENAILRLLDLRMLCLALNKDSLARAAEFLGTTQLFICKMPSGLRSHFEDPLLVRSGNDELPTPEAVATRR